ncbi:gamma-glutamyltransferase [Jeotgalibacillus proteolyticus]|uniref:gamma-glutamyltransferase n=1 Tax=Jeotgalibacillus proteolyticus TaxID=2082395 RepID=UPI002468AF09|nr:gamma-glutamyltransferase [Jeotgalibacillus proteolyticus]
MMPVDELDSLPEVASSRDTTYMCVADQEGNCISQIQSIYHEFGSGFIPEGCGFLLQNRGSFFSLDKEHPNTLEPNKRTFHTIIPAMATKNGRPYMLFGTMGGEGQPQTQCALLTRVVDFGYDVQQAIEAPRWLFGRTWGDSSSTLKLEGRIPDAVTMKLSDLGHEVERVEGYSQTMGHAQAILIDEKTGIYSAGADPRGDGIALSW